MSAAIDAITHKQKYKAWIGKVTELILGGADAIVRIKIPVVLSTKKPRIGNAALRCEDADS